MKEKINLTLEKSIKEKARRIARSRNLSVSEVVEKLILSLDEPKDNWQPEEGSILSKMAGSITNTKQVDYDELLVSELMKKEGYEEDSD